MAVKGNSSQEYLFNTWVSQCSIIGPALFLLYIDDLPDDVIFIIAIYAFITVFFIIIKFNVISHRAEILVPLLFAVRADINQMSKVLQQYSFLGT